MQFHPLANIFPLIEGTQFSELVEDIRANGLSEPIIVYGNQILDGRNRFLACEEAGIKPIFRGEAGLKSHPDWDESVWTCPVCQDQSEEAVADCSTCKRFRRIEIANPVALVVSLNLKRRHLTESQRAAAGAELANLPNGGDRRSDQSKNSYSDPISQANAADMLKVSRLSVNQAAQVKRDAPEVFDAVKQGRLSVNLAKQIAELSYEDQKTILRAADPKAIKHQYKDVTFKQAEAKKEARIGKENALAEATIEASKKIGTQVYGVVYADPPWRFEPYSRTTGMDRAADNHYPTEPTEAIASMRVPSAEDSVLFLWATVPMLPDALSVMNAWGFQYKSHVVWIKDRIGTGYWARNKHELLLIGTKGLIPAPSPGMQFISAIEAPLEQHSKKPVIFAEAIEAMFPSTPKLEMFCRFPRIGWDCWGNQAEGIAA